MSDKRAFRGVWIPAEIWLSRDLTLQEKVMLVEIDSLQAGERGCYKSNKRFAEFFQLSPSRVSEIISGLAKKGWLRIEQIRNGKQVIERRLFIACPLTGPEEGIRETEGGYSGNAANPIRNPEGGYSGNAEERGSGLRGSVEGKPTLSDAGDQRDSIYDRAANLDDDGQPINPPADTLPDTLPRKLPMRLDWQPDPEQLAMACQRAGLPADTTAELHQLAKFTAHHADTGRTQGASAWHARLADWLRNDQRQQAQHSNPASGGARHANRQPRTPARRLTAAEARRRAREQPAEQCQPAERVVYDGEYAPVDG